jgi:hypothetical protein
MKYVVITLRESRSGRHPGWVEVDAIEDTDAGTGKSKSITYLIRSEHGERDTWRRAREMAETLIAEYKGKDMDVVVDDPKLSSWTRRRWPGGRR